MKKSIIASIAAAAAIFTAGAGTNANAAEIQNQPVQIKSYVQAFGPYHINEDQLKQLIQSADSKELQNLLNNCLQNSSIEANNAIKEAIKRNINQPANKQAVKKPAQTTQKTTQPAPSANDKATNNQTPKQSQTASSVNAFEKKVVELTNAERQKQGLKPLVLDEALSKVAREKSLDMQRNKYFSHTSPTYGSPFDMMKKFGISFRTAGENIAMGQRTPEEVVNAWMNSSGHRQNILNPNFTHIGVGYVENGNYWTQMFIGK
ncbi:MULTISPECIES: CAP domain-containing protein [Aeribacillus]|uniref:CAP domain-containing protein n=1 Tax=Aeribacillus TaxID=1055323 RepID=UPI002E1B106C|nr:CAP domain-containing protein [Aeribacillus composti]